MDRWFEFLLDLLSQIAGGRGEMKNELVRFGLGALLWGVLLSVAVAQQRKTKLRREKLLAWGFGVGLIRELFMFAIFSLRILDAIDSELLHVFFPPLEHALAMAAVVMVAGAFLQYMLDNASLARLFLRIGLGACVLGYLSTFWWWARYIAANPQSKFGEVWCDWVFHVLTCGLLVFSIAILITKTGWLRNVVCLALSFFLMDNSLKLVDMYLKEGYEDVLAPIRHGFHILAVFVLGFVYWRELSLERRRLQKEVLEISDREKRQLGQDLHDGLIQQISGIAFLSELLAKDLKSKSIGQSNEAEEINRLLCDTIGEARNLVKGLYPVDLERIGLVSALEALAKNTVSLFHVPCKFSCTIDDLPLDIECATHVYRIAQEAVNNAVKHSNCEEVMLEIGRVDGRIVVTVADDGDGIRFRDGKLPSMNEGMGLHIMAYRASMIDGDLSIRQREKGGTIVTCTFDGSATKKRLLEYTLKGSKYPRVQP